MKKLSAIILSLSVASIAFANTQAFVHTNRLAKVENASKLYHINDLAPAQGLSIESKEGQKVSLVLSTKAVIDIEGKAKLEIKEATQDSPISYNKENSYEQSRSETFLKLDYGELKLRLPSLRPTSSFKIETANGIYTIDCKYFKIISKENKDKVLIYEGSASFSDSKSNIKMNEDMLYEISKENGRIRNKYSPASANTALSPENQFKNLDLVYDSTHFSKDMKAQRVLSEKLKFESIKNSNHKD